MILVPNPNRLYLVPSSLVDINSKSERVGFVIHSMCRDSVLNAKSERVGYGTKDRPHQCQIRMGWIWYQGYDVDSMCRDSVLSAKTERVGFGIEDASQSHRYQIRTGWIW